MIENLLDKLSEIQSAIDALNLEKAQRRAEILKDVQSELDALEVEFAPQIQTAQANATAVTDAIKAAVIQQGATARGAYLMAVYSKPRVTWDSKLLEGYAVAHPEINQAKRVGEPSVSIRGIA